MNVHARLARNLKRLRAANGLSQEALAHEAGLHRTYLSDLERGERNPTIDVIDRIAKAYDVTLGTLLD